MSRNIANMTIQIMQNMHDSLTQSCSLQRQWVVNKTYMLLNPVEIYIQVLSRQSEELVIPKQQYTLFKAVQRLLDQKQYAQQTKTASRSC